MDNLQELSDSTRNSPERPQFDLQCITQSVDQSPSPSPPTTPILSAPPTDLLNKEDICDNPTCNENAVIVCAICNEAPCLTLDPQIAQYCTTECQRADCLRHAPFCEKMQDQTTLYRVMSAALRQLYIYREMCWHAFRVESVERMVAEKDEEVVVFKGVYSTLHFQVPIADEKFKRVQDPVWPKHYREFPAHLLKYKEDRESLLVFSAKFDAVSWALEWIHGMLGGIVMEIEQVVHAVANAPRKMIHEEEIKNSSISPGRKPRNISIDEISKESVLFWEDTNCEVIKVRLRSGEEYAIDLAAAQYGYFDQPVVEWNEYEKTRILSMTTIAPQLVLCTLRPHDFRLSVRVKTFITYMSDEDERDLLIRQLEALNIHMMEWQFESKMSLEKLWEAPEKVFKEKIENFHDYLEWKLHRFYKVNSTVRGRYLARVMRLRKGWDFEGNIL